MVVVVKQKLPEMLISLFYINIVYLIGFKSSFVSSSDIQSCWYGVEDDNINWKNLSCATNQASLPNTIAAKSLPYQESSNQTNENSETSSTGMKYFCLAFKYNQTSVNPKTGDKVLEVKADYTCDTERLCAGRNMYEGYKFYNQSKNVSGYLYCCDSGNNCNTHQLLYTRIHQHTCYTGDSKTHSLRIDHCPQQKSHCVRTRTTKISPGSSEVETIDETYGCDVNNQVCSNLTEAQNHSCRQTMTKVGNDTIETQTCCCKSDNCYKPPWAEGDLSRDAKSKPSAQNTWQRTMLIIIGVALGILLMGATIFFLRKAAILKKKNDSPGKQYNKTAYRSVTVDNGIVTDDTVQILST